MSKEKAIKFLKEHGRTVTEAEGLFGVLLREGSLYQAKPDLFKVLDW